MSQDRTEMRFSLPAAGKKKLGPVLELADRLAKAQGAGPVAVSNAGRKFRITIDFCALDEPERASLLTELHRSGAGDIICTTWFDKVGERLVSSWVAGKVLTFESLEALREHQKDAAGSSAPVLDYGRDRNNKTAVIRLRIKTKGKRQKIVGLFSMVVDSRQEADLARFREQFDSLVKHHSLDIRWCATKWQDESNWSEATPELIRGLKFVVEDAEFIYLGFDLQSIDFVVRDAQIERLIVVMGCLEGVSKTWMKIRPGAHTVKERYIYNPGMGDCPMLLIRDLTQDSDWPQ
jgi:hypothetical protein